MPRLDVFFASNHNFVQHMAVALRSLLAKNPKLPLNVHILNWELDSKTFSRLETLTEGYDCKIINTHITSTRFDHLALPPSHLTKDTYFRLLIPQFVEAERALYLDADTIVNGDLSELLSLDLKCHYLAAVEDLCFNGHNALGLNSTSRYFNTGVMLLNIKRWREDNLMARIIEYAEKNGDNLLFADQCAINAVVDGNWLPLPPKFNQQSAFFDRKFLAEFRRFKEEELREAQIRPLIIHFTGSCKPWHILNAHPFKRLYWQHLRRTPFKTVFSSDLNLKMFLIWLLPANLRGILKRLKDSAFNAMSR